MRNNNEQARSAKSAVHAACDLELLRWGQTYVKLADGRAGGRAGGQEQCIKPSDGVNTHKENKAYGCCVRVCRCLHERRGASITFDTIALSGSVQQLA